MKKTWLVSDTHFGHSEIIKYQRSNYKNVTDMNEQIIEQWNSKIAPNDIVIHLGDVATLMSQDKLKVIISMLNGEKILIPGNHERPNLTLDRHYYNQVGFTNVEQDIPHMVIGKLVLSHEPVDFIPDGYFNIHGHVHQGPSRELFDKDLLRLNICMKKVLEPLELKEEWINGDFTTLKK